MTWNYLLRVILFQVSIVVSGTQGQYWKNNGGTSTKFIYPTSAHYPSNVSPYQYSYNYGSSGYPPRPVPSSYPFSSPVPYYTQIPNTVPEGLQAQQQYFLGPMTMSQAKYLLSYVKSLMQYGTNQMSAAQVPSTPTLNASPIQPTPKVPSSTPIPYKSPDSTPVPSVVPLESSTPAPMPSHPTSVPIIVPLESSTPAPMPSHQTPVPIIVSSESSTSAPNISSLPTAPTMALPEISIPDSPESASAPPLPIALEVILPNSNTSETINSTGVSNSTLMSPLAKSNEPIVGTAQAQSNPFGLGTLYGTAGSWPYNPPVASFYGNQPLNQPLYPPGFGPWNPFVYNPKILPMPQPNKTQQEIPEPLQSGQENSTETSSTNPDAEGGFTNVEDLPPQVKEFINMIPDILAMPESSQLNPSNQNAIIHQLSGGSPNEEEVGVHQFEGGSPRTTPKPKSYLQRPKNSLRSKRRRFKSLLHAGKDVIKQ